MADRGAKFAEPLDGTDRIVMGVVYRALAALTLCRGDLSFLQVPEVLYGSPADAADHNALGVRYR